MSESYVLPLLILSLVCVAHAYYNPNAENSAGCLTSSGWNEMADGSTYASCTELHVSGSNRIDEVTITCDASTNEAEMQVHSKVSSTQYVTSTYSFENAGAIEKVTAMLRNGRNVFVMFNCDETFMRAVVATGKGADFVATGDNHDTVHTNEGEDTLIGRGGNDVLDGGPDKNIMHGGAGSDILLSKGKNDVLIGGLDSDVLNSRWGRDFLFGGDYLLPNSATLGELRQLMNALQGYVAQLFDAASGVRVTDLVPSVFCDDGVGDDLANPEQPQVTSGYDPVLDLIVRGACHPRFSVSCASDGHDKVVIQANDVANITTLSVGDICSYACTRGANSLRTYASGLNSPVELAVQNDGTIVFSKWDTADSFFRLDRDLTVTAIGGIPDGFPYVATDIEFIEFGPEIDGVRHMYAANFARQLVRKDPNTGANTVLGTFAGADNEQGLAIVGTRLYASGGPTTPFFYRIDDLINAPTVVTRFTLPIGCFGVEHAETADRLFILRSNGRLYEVLDRDATPAVSEVSSSFFAAQNFAVDADAQFAYGVVHGAINRLDIASGVVTTFQAIAGFFPLDVDNDAEFGPSSDSGACDVLGPSLFITHRDEGQILELGPII